MSSYALSLSKILQKQRVDKAIPIVKILLYLATFIPILLLVREVINGKVQLSTALTRLENNISSGTPQKSVVSTKEAAQSNPNIIVEKSLFGVVGAPTTNTSASTQKPVSKVPLTLVGTFLSPTEASSAIIEDKRKGVQDSFDLNDSIFGEAKLVSIHPDRVEIDRNGQIEVLKLEEGLSDSSSLSTASSSNEIVVSEQDVDNALGNLPLLLTEVRAVPFFKDGAAVGLRLFAIKQGSLFEKVGLKNGDILKTINGNNLGDFTQAMKLFEKLKTERSLTLSLERNKEDKEFHYTIK